MLFENKFHVSLFVCSCFCAFLFVYLLPFIYIGYNPYREDPLVCNPTVLKIPGSTYENYPPPTKFALAFAKHIKTRLLLTIMLIGIGLVTHLIKIRAVWKILICHVIMWGSIFIFCISYIGLLFFLVRN
jgi:hypothetical protein